MTDLRFYSVNDTDENELDAIQPITNEPADPSVANRPHDRLRERTEVLRAQINKNDFRFREGLRYTLYEETVPTTLTWYGAWDGTGTPTTEGTFTISDDLLITSMMGPGELRDTGALGAGAEKYWGGGTPFATQYSWQDFSDGVSDTMRLVALDSLAGGGQFVSFEVVRSSTNLASPTVVVNGVADAEKVGFVPGKVSIVVTISRGDPGDVVTDVNDVINLLNTDSETLLLVDAYLIVDGGGAGANPMPEVAKTFMRRGSNAVAFRLTPGNLAAFFAATDDNRLREGDVLAVQFADVQSWLGHITEAGGGIDIDGASELLNFTRASEGDVGDTPILPLGRCLGGKLHLINGTSFIPAPTGAAPRIDYHAGSIPADTISKTGFSTTEQTVAGQLDDLATAVADLADGTINTDYLGINEPTPQTRLHISETGSGAQIRLERTETGTPAGSLGDLEWYSNEAGNDGVRARIITDDDGTGTALEFYTSGNGAVPAAEDMPLRIANNAVVSHGTFYTDFIRPNVETSVEVNVASGRLYVEGDGIELREISLADRAFTIVSATNTLHFEDKQTALAASSSLGRLDFSTDDTDNAGVTARLDIVSDTTSGTSEFLFYSRATTTSGDVVASDLVFRLGRADIELYRPTGITAEFTSTSTVANVLTLVRTTSGTAAAGIGASLDIHVEDTAGSATSAALITASLTDTGATEDSELSIYLKSTGTVKETLRLVGDPETGIGSLGIKSDILSAFITLPSMTGSTVASFHTTQPGPNRGAQIILANEDVAGSLKDSASTISLWGARTTEVCERASITAYAEGATDVSNSTLVLCVNDGTSQTALHSDTAARAELSSNGDFTVPGGSVVAGATGAAFVGHNAPVANGAFTQASTAAPTLTAGFGFGTLTRSAQGLYNLALSASLSASGANAIVQVSLNGVSGIPGHIIGRVLDADTIRIETYDVTNHGGAVEAALGDDFNWAVTVYDNG